MTLLLFFHTRHERISTDFDQLVRDSFAIQTWLSIGAVLQGIAILMLGRVALVPALVYLVGQSLDTGAMVAGWKRNKYMDGVIMKKTSAQIPNAFGNYGNKPADTDVVVFLIGTRCNHPLGILAPGMKDLGGYFPKMVEDLEAHAEEFGFLGMTSWLNTSQRTSHSELMQVGYFKTVEGLHAFAHSEYHRAAWSWWNKHTKQYPHLSIFHETYHVPKGHWETIYVNYHTSGLASATVKVTDEKTGEAEYMGTVVDASKGVLRTSAGRMARSFGDEHEKYEEAPY
jgi:hypothetical protein